VAYKCITLKPDTQAGIALSLLGILSGMNFEYNYGMNPQLQKTITDLLTALYKVDPKLAWEVERFIFERLRGQAIRREEP